MDLRVGDTGRATWETARTAAAPLPAPHLDLPRHSVNPFLMVLGSGGLLEVGVGQIGGVVGVVAAR